MSRASSSKCNMTLLQQPGEEKLLIVKPKALRFNTANISYKIAQVFGFVIGLSRSTCF